MIRRSEDVNCAEFSGGHAAASDEGLVSDESQAAKIVLVPSGVGDHCPEGSNREGVAEVVVGYYHSAPIRMPVDSMAASGGPPEDEAVSVKGLDELSRGSAARHGAHTLTATDGVGNSSVPRSGSRGIGSPASRMLTSAS